MNKKLIRQMLNEWRTNLWLLVEFLVVSVVIWYIADSFYVSGSITRMPKGFNADHTYLLTLYEITDKSPEYIAGRTDEERAADKLEILERLKRRPEVEAASYSMASFPYNGSSSTFSLRYDTIWASGLRRLVTPEFVRVFGYEGMNGETAEQLEQALREDKVLVTDNFFTQSVKGARTMTELGSAPLYYQDNDSATLTPGPVLKPVRYSDYSTWSPCVVIPSMEEILWLDELCIRVRPDMDRDIAEALMRDAPSQFHVGNFTLTDVKSFVDIRHDFQRDRSNQERNRTACMAFLLVNVFLGLLGTFWFRTQQRVREMGLRKVSGATPGMVFGRLIAEGLILLTAATVPALAVDWLLTHFEYNAWLYGYFGVGRWLLCALFTSVIMARMVVAGIWFPARRAMRVDPAQALANE